MKEEKKKKKEREKERQKMTIRNLRCEHFLQIAISTGGTVIVRSKFSASLFWKEVAAHKCTVIQYIGELCRYLVNTPTSCDVSNHQVLFFFMRFFEIFDEHQISNYNVITTSTSLSTSTSTTTSKIYVNINIVMYIHIYVKM